MYKDRRAYFRKYEKGRRKTTKRKAYLKEYREKYCQAPGYKEKSRAWAKSFRQTAKYKKYIKSKKYKKYIRKYQKSPRYLEYVHGHRRTPEEKERQRHRYHLRVAKKFENCQKCQEKT